MSVRGDPPTSTKEAVDKLRDTARGLGMDGGASAMSLANTKLWLEALHDPVAGIRAYSPCLTTLDAFGDGDWRLVVACVDKKLRVWRGTDMKTVIDMLEMPVAAVSFNAAVAGNSRGTDVAALAVASGANVYIYRNLRPYYKFALPSEPPNEEEALIWSQISGGGLELQEAQAQLLALRDRGVELTERSSEFILQPEGSRDFFVQSCQGKELMAHTAISCLSKVFKSHEEPDSVSCLMIGTESGKLHILNTLGTAVEKSVVINKEARSIPVHVVNVGVLDVEWRTVVACRDGKVYQLKNGVVQSTVIELEAQCVGLLRNHKSFLIGCMNNVIHHYHMKGSKTYSLYLPAAILDMVAMKANKKMQTIFAVALGNGEVRVYNEKHLVAMHTLSSTVTAMHFGRYGREDNTLVTAMRNGTLDIRMLPRSANLETDRGSSGPPVEQDVPLNIPKKTKQYVEQTQRERDQAVDMHRIFQRDLCKLRLETARAYVKVLTDGQGQISYTTGASLRMKADVAGIGPCFTLKMKIENTGKSPVMNMPIMLVCNEKLYTLKQKQIIAPLLIPRVEYDFSAEVLCNDPSAQYADAVRIVMINGESCIPILSASVRMPLSDMPFE